MRDMASACFSSLTALVQLAQYKLVPPLAFGSIAYFCPASEAAQRAQAKHLSWNLFVPTPITLPDTMNSLQPVAKISLNSTIY